MAVVMKRKETQPTIKTPQELVHIKHRISLRQYKYWILMLRAYREAYEAGEGPDEYGFHRIALTDLAKFIGYEPVKAEVRADLESIRKEPIIYNVLSKDGKTAMRGAGFISEWELSSNWLGFKLPGFLSECVERLDLKSAMFQALNWAVFNSFTGKYEAVLYKLCKDYIGVARTPYMTLKDFREYMGVGEDEYTDFKRLNQWVISGPIKKINESEISDIVITAEFRRESRKIIGLWFGIQPKRQTMLDFGDDPAFRFAKVGISIPQQKKYLEAKSSELIEFSIQRANEYAEELEKKGEAVDLGAIYHTAITQDWGNEFASKLKREEEKRVKKEQIKKAEADMKDMEARRLEFEVEWKERASAAIDTIGENELESFFERFKTEGKVLPSLLKAGTKSKIFRAWLRQEVVPKPTDAEFASWLKKRKRAG